MNAPEKKRSCFGAMIENDFGFDLYLGETQQAIDEQIYDYVREYWNSMQRENVEHPSIDELSPKEAITYYFNYFEGEERFMDFGEMAIVPEGEVVVQAVKEQNP
jgi:hypothetical protein